MGSFDDLDLKVAEKFGKGWAASAAEHVKLSGGVNPDGWWVRPASIGQHAPPTRLSILGTVAGLVGAHMPRMKTCWKGRMLYRVLVGCVNYVRVSIYAKMDGGYL